MTKERKQIEIWGNKFLVPAGDKECHPVITQQVADVNEAIAICDRHNVCVQAGGNMGIWPFYLSTIFDWVYTFEPHPENFFCLSRNCPQENIIKIQAGLGQHPETMNIEGHVKNAGAYQMAGVGYYPVVRLDDFSFHTLDLLTLDIEGMELMALNGAQMTIQEHSPVIMLEDKGLSDKYGSKKGDVVKFLSGFGYEVHKEIHRDVILKKVG